MVKDLGYEADMVTLPLINAVLPPAIVWVP